MYNIKLRKPVSIWPVVGRFGYIPTSVSKLYERFVSKLAEIAVCFHHTAKTDSAV
jgi:hypothetical protein